MRRTFSAIIFCAIFFSGAVFGSFTGSRAEAQAPSAPGKPLPAGPMQGKVKATCTGCHNAARISEQHLTRSQWSAELEKMEGLGAVIPDADRSAMLNYLAKNFGPAKGSVKSGTNSGGTKTANSPD